MVLRLDDDSMLTESIDDAEYLEELYSLLALIGNTLELNFTKFIHNAYHYSEVLARFKSRTKWHDRLLLIFGFIMDSSICLTDQ